MATGMNLGGATFNVNANILPFQRGLQQAQQQAQATGAAISQQLNRGTKNAAMGFLELSRAVEDAQYGLRGVINNIPTAVQMFGGGAGLAAGISLASVAVNQLVEHWADLKDAMQAAWAGSTVEQLKQVREGAEAAAAAFKKLAETPTKGQAAAQKALGEAIIEGDVGKVLGAVFHAMANNKALSVTAEEAIAADPNVLRAEAGPMALHEKMTQMNREKAAGLVGAASQGDKAALGTLSKMVRDNPGAFPPGFMTAIEDLDPARRADQAKLEKEGELRGANQRQGQRMAAEERRRIEEQRELEIKGRRLERDRVEKMAKEREKADREEERQNEKDAQYIRHAGRIGRQVDDIVRGVALDPGQSELMGLAAFGNKLLTDPMNNTADLQRKQLAALEKIVRLMEDNPDLAAGIAVQAGIAVAGGPN